MREVALAGDGTGGRRHLGGRKHLGGEGISRARGGVAAAALCGGAGAAGRGWRTAQSALSLHMLIDVVGQVALVA
jgi:hypothetical protein